jgi:hypothetical protein
LASEVFLAELYLALLAVVGLVAADLAVSGVAPSYLRDRAEAQAVLREIRAGGRRRPRPRLVARAEELRARLRRAALARMAVLTPVYAALAFGALTHAWPVPLNCCIPVVSVRGDGVCYSSSAFVAAFAFLAFLPLVQEEAVFILREVIAGRRGRNKL